MMINFWVGNLNQKLKIQNKTPLDMLNYVINNMKLKIYIKILYKLTNVMLEQEKHIKSCNKYKKMT